MHVHMLASKVLKGINEERTQLQEQGKVLREERKQTQDKYFSQLDKFLGASARKSDAELSDHEAKVASLRQSWARSCMHYAQYLNLFQLSKGVIAGHVVGFMQSMATVSSECRAALSDHEDVVDTAASAVECIRAAGDEQLEISERLISETLDLDDESISAPINGIKRGFLLLQTRGMLGVGSAWTRCFCIFDKAAHRFFCHTDDKDCIVVEVDTCVQKFSADIDRKFVFEITGPDTKLTLQASSDADRKGWIAAMGGLAPVKTVRRKKGRKHANENTWQTLSPESVGFLLKMMSHVERSYLDFEGLYRVSGTKTRYIKMYTDALQKHRLPNLADEDVTVITSCLKYFLRQLPDPLLTRRLYPAFIDAVRAEDRSMTVSGADAGSRRSSKPEVSPRPPTTPPPEMKLASDAAAHVYGKLPPAAKTAMQPPARPPVPPKPQKTWTVRALYNCDAEDEEELTFRRGDLITDVEPFEDEGWFVGTLQSTQQRGLFPYNYVEDVFNPTAATPSSPGDKNAGDAAMATGGVVQPQLLDEEPLYENAEMVKSTSSSEIDRRDDRVQQQVQDVIFRCEEDRVTAVTRNVCIIAHVDHGKTTLADSVLSRAGVLNDAKAGKALALDTEAAEQERGITIKSTGISLHYPDWAARVGVAPGRCRDGAVVAPPPRNNEEGFLRVNLIDCPGHADFSGEVTTALRVCDGALVIVDCVEGVGVQTETVVRQALAEHVQPVLFLNKLDRIITELQATPEDAYMKVAATIDSVNELIETYQPEGVDFTVDPCKGTVGFGSGLYGWGFTLPQIGAALVQKKQAAKATKAGTPAPPAPHRASEEVMKLTKRLWGDYFVDPSTGKWRRDQGFNADGSAHQRTFCAVVLQPIYAVHAAESSGDRAALLKLAGTLGVAAAMTETQKRESELKPLRKLMMKAWLPVADALLALIDDHLPSPLEAQPARVHAIYQGVVDDDGDKAAEDEQDVMSKGERNVVRAMQHCDPHGPAVVFITKMVRVSKQSKAMIGFGRVFCGTVRVGDTLHALDPDYTPPRTNDDDDSSSSSSSSAAKSGGRVRGAVPVSVKGLRLVMASRMQPIKEGRAGMVVGVLGLDGAVVKAGTLTSTLAAHPLKVLRFSVSPVVRVSVRPKKESLATKLQQAMQSLQQEDPCVLCYTDSATGEKILAGVGELHVQLCLDALSEAVGCSVVATEPAVQYCEGVAQESTQVCLAKSSNKHNRLYVKARPASDDLVAALDDGSVSMQMDTASRTAALVAAGADRALAKKVVAMCGSNVLVDETVGMDLNPILDMVVTAFKDVCAGSVLCHEELRGVVFSITDARLHQDSVHRRVDQILPMARRAFHGAVLTAHPRLLQPIFAVTIQVPQEGMGGVRRVLKDRGGAVVGETVVAGTPLHTVRAHLPVARSFGFNSNLMRATSGKAFPTTTFGHWAMVEGDPLDPATPAGQAVAAVRARKRMTKPHPPAASELLDRL
ncbi:hypothetical protein PTSG_12302 [Salpingoeca rosetta]|uniref:Uncharacterized protein n=1 Tax=Salpingoeca rosetta (strain ATCC 50818 / BSB-021) TaxID=946362 RepID=F2UA81_SALR5|nr:uncharacterized protein PTSG_12302 [Salpingoeca rosetta]EGD73656.1 hypothetical protein PTSG_12302 [Salpingoeca rosetta]|eukprot:XP_004993937.1 hypothetical protein PTSG_12302 [Salpingoeca rosetta]